MPPHISGWPPTCTVTAKPSASGALDISSMGPPVCRMRRGRVGHGAFPPSEQVDVLSVATAHPAASHCRATRWSLDDMLTVLRQHHRCWLMSRSSLWRIVEEADLKPHRRVYWLNSHAPAFEAKARDIWQLYVNALRFYEAGRPGVCPRGKTRGGEKSRTNTPRCRRLR